MRWVWDTEEKGSDVNLAVELDRRAWLNLYDMAVVISNDSDLERAVYDCQTQAAHRRCAGRWGRWSTV